MGNSNNKKFVKKNKGIQCREGEFYGQIQIRVMAIILSDCETSEYANKSNQSRFVENVFAFLWKHFVTKEESNEYSEFNDDALDKKSHW